MKINTDPNATILSQKYKSKQNEIEAMVPKFQDILENKDKEALKKAATDFEELFVGMLMKTMRASVPKSNLSGESTYQKDIFEGMLDEAYAKRVAESGSFGIADMVMQSFEPYLKNQVLNRANKEFDNNKKEPIKDSNNPNTLDLNSDKK